MYGGMSSIVAISNLDLDAAAAYAKAGKAAPLDSNLRRTRCRAKRIILTPDPFQESLALSVVTHYAGCLSGL